MCDQYDPLFRRMFADPHATLGLVVDFSTPVITHRQFASLIPADEWRSLALFACDRRWFFVGAGRPFKPEARGFYMLAQDAANVPHAVMAAHARMAEAESTATLWTTFTDGALRDRISSLLAQVAATEGNA